MCANYPEMFNFIRWYSLCLNTWDRNGHKGEGHENITTLAAHT